jgi:hypothetical protein
MKCANLVYRFSWYLDVCSMLICCLPYSNNVLIWLSLRLVWSGVTWLFWHGRTAWWRLGLPVASRTSHMVVGSGLLMRRSYWRCCLKLTVEGDDDAKGRRWMSWHPWSPMSSWEMPFSPKTPPHKVLFFPDLLCSSLVFHYWSSCKSSLLYGRHLRQ